MPRKRLAKSNLQSAAYAQQGRQVAGPMGVQTAIAWLCIVMSPGLSRLLLFTPDPRKSVRHTKRCMRHVHVITIVASFRAVSGVAAASSNLANSDG
jgi:hypothetical protein